MFEIIMLFAFMYAATCQLFPEETATTRSSSKEKYQPREAKNRAFNLPLQSHLPSQNHGSTQKKISKTRSRNHSYADAA